MVPLLSSRCVCRLCLCLPSVALRLGVSCVQPGDPATRVLTQGWSVPVPGNPTSLCLLPTSPPAVIVALHDDLLAGHDLGDLVRTGSIRRDRTEVLFAVFGHDGTGFGSIVENDLLFAGSENPALFMFVVVVEGRLVVGGIVVGQYSCVRSRQEG